MDFKGEQVVATEQTDDWLLAAAQDNAAAAREIAEAAQARGLALPAFAGTVTIGAVEAAQRPLAEETRRNVEAQLPVARQVYDTLIGYVNLFRINHPALKFDRGYEKVYREVYPAWFKDKKRKPIEPVDEETFKQEWAAWFTEDKRNYVAKAQAADPELFFTLTAIPNTPIPTDEVYGIGHALSVDRPRIKLYGLLAMNNPYLYYVYTGEQLAGYVDEGTRVRFALTPSKPNPELHGNVEGLRQALRSLQANYPFLRAQSIVEYITEVEARRTIAHNRGEDPDKDLPINIQFDLPEIPSAPGAHHRVIVAFHVSMGEYTLIHQPLKGDFLDGQPVKYQSRAAVG